MIVSFSDTLSHHFLNLNSGRIMELIFFRVGGDNFFLLLSPRCPCLKPNPQHHSSLLLNVNQYWSPVAEARSQIDRTIFCKLLGQLASISNLRVIGHMLPTNNNHGGKFATEASLPATNWAANQFNINSTSCIFAGFCTFILFLLVSKLIDSILQITELKHLKFLEHRPK